MARTIEISDETFEKIKDQLAEEEQIDLASLDDFVGKAFFFRTVTYHVTGKVIKRMGDFLQLEKAAWVADSGRFMQAINEGTLKEVEPVKVPVWINIKSCTDIYLWKHDLPREQK